VRHDRVIGEDLAHRPLGEFGHTGVAGGGPPITGLRGQRQRQLGVPASGVQHVAAELAAGDQRGQFRLRLTDVPRRRTLEFALLAVCIVPVDDFR